MRLAQASPSRLDTTWPHIDRYFGLNIRIASTRHPMVPIEDKVW